jgi:hypothetical protein
MLCAELWREGSYWCVAIDAVMFASRLLVLRWDWRHCAKISAYEYERQHAGDLVARLPFAGVV